MNFSLSKSWRLLAWVAAFVLFSPIVALLIEALFFPSPIFSHLFDTVLFDYIKNSVILVIGVSVLAVIWGLPSAWMVARYQFFGRRYFRWLLLLPLVMPSYLVAYVYTDLLDFAGPVQIFLRDSFGLTGSLLEMRSMGGAMFVLSLVFSPYVYWLCLMNFKDQPASLYESAELLGANSWQQFFKIALPLVRGSLVIGITLVAMETLADFGTVSYFSVWHLTTGIYDTWLGYSDLSAAAKMSVMLLIFVIVLVVIERRSRAKASLALSQSIPLALKPTSKAMALVMSTWCFLIVALGFVLPISILIYQAIRYVDQTQWQRFGDLIINSVSLGITVAIIATLLALLFAVYQRIYPQRGKLTASIASLGYAVPGTVMAVAVLIVVTIMDRALNNALVSMGFSKIGLLFAGSLFAMGFAFLARFQTIAIGSVNSKMEQVSASIDESAYLLGSSIRRVVLQIWLPLLKSGLLTAFLLVFLESMKELSAAILLRPFNVDTLTTYVFELMSADQFEQAAFPALLILLAGLPTVWVISKTVDRQKQEQHG